MKTNIDQPFGSPAAIVGINRNEWEFELEDCEEVRITVYNCRQEEAALEKLEEFLAAVARLKRIDPLDRINLS